MKNATRLAWWLVTCAACAAPLAPEPQRSDTAALGNVPFHLKRLDVDGPFGTTRTISTNAKLDTSTQPFFVALGTNGRACVHCHAPTDAWTITPASLEYRFTHPLDVGNALCLTDPKKCAAADPASWGTDPVFRPNDGAVSPLADVSTPEARRSAYALLLSKGLIRVGMPVPPDAEFELAAVDDPYGYASAAELSLFRRPLPATNLHNAPGTKQDPKDGTPVLTAVMWDGRETLPNRDILADLLDQANGATLGHAQAIAGLAPQQLADIVTFETGLATAQIADANAGDLTKKGANGGPDPIAAQTFYLGINDPLTGDSATGAPFSPDVFTMYDAWKDDKSSATRAAVARGQAIFNRKPIAITGVKGLNDLLDAETVPGTCTTCHDTPSFGHHSIKLALDVGVASAARRTPDLPLYTLRNKATEETIQTTDPGVALVTGRWNDVGKFKGPILRGLAARPPYFHDGSAASIDDVVDFYDGRFAIGLTAAEKSDLVAFLRAL